jgi:prepilin-type N-terminal cleavage/methylation domain-containing protein
MSDDKKNNFAGVTLIELIITLAILSIVSLAIFSFFNFGLKLYSVSNNQIEVQNDVRLSILTTVDKFKYARELETLSITRMTAELSDANNKYDYIYFDGSKLIMSEYDEASSSRVVSIIANSIDSSKSFFQPQGTDVLLFRVASINKQGQEFYVDEKIKLINFSVGSTNTALSGSKNYAIKFMQSSLEYITEPVAGELSISLNKNFQMMMPDETFTLVATVKNSDGNISVTWDSSDAAIASVNASGVVAAGNTLGIAIITATSVEDPSRSVNCEVTVDNNFVATNLYFQGPLITKIYIGDPSVAIKAIIEPSNATSIPLDWNFPSYLTATLSADKMTASVEGKSVGTGGEIIAQTTNGIEARYSIEVKELGPSNTGIDGQDKQEVIVIFNKNLKSPVISVTSSSGNDFSAVVSDQKKLKINKATEFISGELVTVIIESSDGGKSQFIIKNTNGNKNWDFISQNLKY